MHNVNNQLQDCLTRFARRDLSAAAADNHKEVDD